MVQLTVPLLVTTACLYIVPAVPSELPWLSTRFVGLQAAPATGVVAGLAEEPAVAFVCGAVVPVLVLATGFLCASCWRHVQYPPPAASATTTTITTAMSTSPCCRFIRCISVHRLSCFHSTPARAARQPTPVDFFAKKTDNVPCYWRCATASPPMTAKLLLEVLGP